MIMAKDYNAKISKKTEEIEKLKAKSKDCKK